MLIWVGKLIIIGSDNGLSPDRRQAIIWTNGRLLSIGPLQTYFSENLIKLQQISLKKMHVKMSAKCLGLNVLKPGYKVILEVLGVPVCCHVSLQTEMLASNQATNQVPDWLIRDLFANNWLSL